MSTQAYAPPEAQPTTKCRPPADTEAGTLCILTNGPVDTPFRWNGRRWVSVFIRDRSHTPSELARRGWWFLRVYVPPVTES